MNLLVLMLAAAPLLDVKWDENTARTGKLLVVDVAVAETVSPMDTLKVAIDDKEGVFAFTDIERRRARALLPVHVDRKLGKATVTIDATLDDGTFTRWQKPVVIRDGKYDKRHITVGKQFTSPSKAQQQRAAVESKMLTEVLATKSDDRLWHGSFVKPVAGEMTSPFGTLRTYNKKRRSRHLGLDLDGKTGDPIVAANRGTVLMAMDRFYSGGTVVIDHGQGFITMYFHMSRMDVAAGQNVERGTLLGAVGASGQVTGPHLHFSVRLDGLYADPTQLLSLKLDDDIAEVARQKPAAEAP